MLHTDYMLTARKYPIRVREGQCDEELVNVVADVDVRERRVKQFEVGVGNMLEHLQQHHHTTNVTTNIVFRQCYGKSNLHHGDIYTRILCISIVCKDICRAFL